MRTPRRQEDARVSCATVEGRMFWQSLGSLQSALSKLNLLYELDAPNGTTEFSFPAVAPITYSEHRLECLQHGRVLKRILGVSEPVLPTRLPWTTGTCEFIRLLESDLSGLLVRFQRHYHTACRYFEGSFITEIDRDHKHQLDCDLGHLGRLLVTFLSFISAVCSY